MTYRKPIFSSMEEFFTVCSVKITETGDGICWGCGCSVDPEYDLCGGCEPDLTDVFISELARHHGSPAKLQIWTDMHTMLGNEKGFGEVEVTCANYSTICFKHPLDGHTVPMRREDFCRWFSFVRTIY
jgi:hypothetical protein